MSNTSVQRRSVGVIGLIPVIFITTIIFYGSHTFGVYPNPWIYGILLSIVTIAISGRIGIKTQYSIPLLMVMLTVNTIISCGISWIAYFLAVYARYLYFG